jgi:uncharacterized membrane protein
LLVRNETIFKWSLYGAATLALFLLQGLVLQRIELWGVFPFLFPVEVAILASYEGPLPGTVFGLVMGVCCDLTVTAAIPCFYTLIFPVVGLAAAGIAGSVISAGPVCSLACSAAGFLVTDLFYALILWSQGQDAWAAVGYLTLRETCVGLLFSPLVFLLYSAVYRKCHVDD